MPYAEAHKEMFMAIANGEVSCKREWLDKTAPTPFEYELKNDCFACEEAYRRKNEKREDNFGLCKYCPITPKEHPDCCSGLYHEWWREDDKDRARELAREIANLEWN